MNNKIIYGVFALLLLVYLGITFIGKEDTGNFKEDILKLDKNKLSKIEITPKDKSKKFSLIKENDIWQIDAKGKKYEMDTNAIKGILQSFSNLKAKDVVTKNTEKYAKYELEDDKSKKIAFYYGSKKVKDLLIGKLNFNQQVRSAKSYFREKNAKEVYSTEGFLSMSIPADFNSFRNKSLLNFDSKKVNSFDLNENNFSKQENKWLENNEPADSLKVENYLKKIARINGNQFDNNFSPNGKQAVNTLKINISDENPIELKAYVNTTNNGFILNSSLNPNAYFKSDSSGIYKQIFEF